MVAERGCGAILAQDAVAPEMLVPLWQRASLWLKACLVVANGLADLLSREVAGAP